MVYPIVLYQYIVIQVRQLTQQYFETVILILLFQDIVVFIDGLV